MARSAFDTERFVAEVCSANVEGGQEAVEEQLKAAFAQPDEVMRALGEPNAVGPLPIYQSTNLTVVNVVWSPLMVLLPHDHKMWATIGIYSGREDNIIWQRIDGSIEPAGAKAIAQGEVFSLPKEAIHSVVNPLGRHTGAIHVYGGDFFQTQKSEWDPETLQERPMDFSEKQKQFREADERFEGKNS